MKREKPEGRKTLIEQSDVLNKPQEVGIVDSDINPHVVPFPPHWHYYMEIVYVIEGSIRVENDGESYPLYAGDFVMFRPEVVHAYYRNGNRFRYIFVKFDISRIHSASSYVPKMDVILRSLGNEQHAPMLFRKEKIADLQIEGIFREIYEELNSQQYGYDLVAENMISTLLVRILRIWRKDGYNLDAAISEDTEGISIHNITAYIDAHAGEDLRVEQLANLCSMSYSYFAKSFHSLYGRSCKEYIEHIRISKAEELLLFTDCDLSYIAQETGFADSSHLIKTFRRLKGLTPKQYKMQNRVTEPVKTTESRG